jgi:hypothetical protein
MRTQRIVFEEVTRWSQKSVKCEGCGKRVNRAKTFLQTINPFNTTATGTVKDREQINRELADEVAAWRRKPERCSKCSV